jgi:hypothetical protein
MVPCARKIDPQALVWSGVERTGRHDERRPHHTSPLATPTWRPGPAHCDRGGVSRRRLTHRASIEHPTGRPTHRGKHDRANRVQWAVHTAPIAVSGRRRLAVSIPASPIDPGQLDLLHPRRPTPHPATPSRDSRPPASTRPRSPAGHRARRNHPRDGRQGPLKISYATNANTLCDTHNPPQPLIGPAN